MLAESIASLTGNEPLRVGTLSGSFRQIRYRKCPTPRLPWAEPRVPMSDSSTGKKWSRVEQSKIQLARTNWEKKVWTDGPDLFLCYMDFRMHLTTGQTQMGATPTHGVSCKTESRWWSDPAPGGTWDTRHLGRTVGNTTRPQGG